MPALDMAFAPVRYTLTVDTPSTAADLRRSVSRTLAANGYVVTRGYTHPTFVTIDLEKPDLFGCRLAYLLVVTDQPRLPLKQVTELGRRGAADGRLLVVISQRGGDGQLSFEEFLERLGGDVPRWRALTDDYHAALLQAAQNQLPQGHVGPAWRLLEELAADGLEFALGRRARRMGGRSSGSRVPDILIVSPDGYLYLLDAKAAASPFDASWPNLRALGEYVDQQKERQRGSFTVDGALLVSSHFAQDKAALTDLALEFRGEHGVMLSFLSAETLSTIVGEVRDNIDIRNALQWRKVFQGGAVSVAAFTRELRRARDQRVSR